MRPESIRWRAALAVALAALIDPSVAQAGIGAASRYALPNPSFDKGLTDWSAWSSDGTMHFSSGANPTTARCSLPVGVQAALSLDVPMGGQTLALAGTAQMPAIGEKIEFGAWVFLGNDCVSGNVYLQVNASDGFSTQTIAESDHLQPGAEPHGQWLYLHTQPTPGFDARIPLGTTVFSLVLRMDAPGTAWFDEVQGGEFEYAEFGLIDPSFEDPALFAAHWNAQGNAAVGAHAGAYYGERYLEFSGSAAASVSQALPILDGRAAPAPKQQSEACAWVFVENDAALSAQSSPQAWIKLRVLAWTSGTPPGAAQEIASVQWNPTSADKRAWKFLQTTPSATPRIPFGSTHLRVELQKSLSGTVRVDFIQVGERFSVNGNPRKLVGCNYLGWFRSPHFPGATTNPVSPSAIWRNWCWTAPPACDPNYAQLAHNPDCSTSPQCFRVNSRRNGATSERTSIDNLPIAGAYDSRDAAVLDYHVKLAKAIGIDNLIFDYQGHELALQIASQGGEPINEESFEGLLDAAEQSGSDLKVAVMYEPKVHFTGWLPNELTLLQKQQGIEKDLKHLLKTHSKRRCALKHDGRLVVYIFRNAICNSQGTQCLDDSAWRTIKDNVELATGREICLIADTEPGLPPASNPFNGMSRWNLLSLNLLEYQTFSDFVNQQASWPAPTPSELTSHAAAVDAQNCRWAAGEDQNRFSVAIAWPGFDDSGVAGWSNNNLTGKDGSPLCVRIASDLGGAFHALTWSAAIDSGSDWIQIATWNDWNEGTQIEPAWDVGYSQAVLNSSTPSALSLERVFRRTYETQSAIAMFKGLALGQGLSPAQVEAVTADYLRAAAFTPGLTMYD
ncbi:MAG TPA: hypothetical protein VK843_06490 [Planctomycetota bacterium]|nr:hypothetical protein [Planctomycetota bacterium]